MSLFFVTNCYAVVWSSGELIEKSKELNGRKLSYKGELVTAILASGEYSWINLNDGSNAIGVWCRSGLLDGVKFAGDYKSRGDVIEVDGILNRACSVHNGELDIHADTVKIVKCGHDVKRVINTNRMQSAAALFVVVLLTIVIFKKRL
ncbi:MAG: DNA-binding protein [Candidatus Omnitrophota bacterium]|nr:DNA-binding protein [Candidatus Omnitrophota bacterium]